MICYCDLESMSHLCSLAIIRTSYPSCKAMTYGDRETPKPEETVWLLGHRGMSISDVLTAQKSYDKLVWIDNDPTRCMAPGIAGIAGLHVPRAPIAKLTWHFIYGTTPPFVVDAISADRRDRRPFIKAFHLGFKKIQERKSIDAIDLLQDILEGKQPVDRLILEGIIEQKCKGREARCNIIRSR